MPAPKKSVAGYVAKKIIKKVKPELKGTLKTPKPNVKVVPTSKTGLTSLNSVPNKFLTLAELRKLKNVPKGVSNRFDATNKRLAAEAAKNKNK